MTKTKMPAKKKLLIALAVLIALGLVLSVSLVAAGSTVASSDTIFPNISIGGVSVGGLTVEEAAKKLEASATEDLSGKAVVIRFSDDLSLEITAQEAGLSVTGAEAAQLAYDYGRTSGVFSRALTYLKCRSGSVELVPSSMLAADEDMVRQSITESVAALTKELTTSSYEIQDEYLVITKGRQGIVIDEDRLVELICSAFSKSEYTVDYEPDTSDPEELDLELIYDSVYTQPENALYEKETDSVSEHIEGISFDIDSAQKLIDAAGQGEEVKIPLIYTQPEITQTYLQEVLFRDTLCSASTSLTSNENRNTNITLAAQAINGTILNPGEQFDYNTVVGQRTAEKGYKSAGAYSGTDTIQTIGGGICQVSSTIYYALLHTDLQIDKRINHSLTVSYLDMGMDAAVSWGGPEFAFTNNTDYPVKITAYRDGLTLYVSIQGTDTSEYTIVPRYVYIGSIAYSTTYKDDSSLVTGETKTETSGINGHVVETYKDYKDASGNVVKSELVDKSTYSPRNAVIIRGTGAVSTPTPDVSTPTPSTPDPVQTDPAEEGETLE